MLSGQVRTDPMVEAGDPGWGVVGVLDLWLVGI